MPQKRYELPHFGFSAETFVLRFIVKDTQTHTRTHTHTPLRCRCSKQESTAIIDQDAESATINRLLDEEQEQQ